MPRTDVPTLVLIFALLVWGATGVFCLLNWYRRRGYGVAFLEILRFVTMGLILFTLCKPEIDRQLPSQADKVVDLVLLADRSDSMTTQDVPIATSAGLTSRERLLDARLGLLGVLTEPLENGEKILQVFEPSPAHAAGLRPGDVLARMEADAKPGATPADTLAAVDQRLGTSAGVEGLNEFLASRRHLFTGREVKMHIRREGAAAPTEPMVVKLNSLPQVIQDELAKRHIQARVYLQEFAIPDHNASAPELQGTDINKAILAELDKYDNLQAIILLSDGDANLGKPPTEEAARRLRDNQIVAHTVTNVGSTVYPPDVELIVDDVPSKGVIDDRIAIPFHVRNHLTSDLATNIFLVTRGGANAAPPKALRVPKRGETAGVFIWEPPGEGNHTLKIELPVVGEELIATNNVRVFNVEIERNVNNVLVIESRPRWEYRYLRNAMMRDPDVDLRVLMIHPGIELGDGSGYIKYFPPRNRTEAQKSFPSPFTLPEYDVIFLGDVGLGAGGLSEEQASDLRAMVEHHSSGLVFMPGPTGRQLTFYRWKNHTVAEGDNLASIAARHRVAARTMTYANPNVDWSALAVGTVLNVPHPLADLFPVAYDTRAPIGDWTTTESRFSLMPEGRNSPLLLLARQGEGFDNEDLWRDFLPGFFWHAGVLRDVPGSQILAIHSSRRNQYGYLPLLVTQPVGNGQTLFMGTDSAWRWRRFVGADYHYRFWGQVVRWMGHRRKQATGRGMRLVFATERPAMGEVLSMEAILTDWAGIRPNEKVTATVTLPNNATRPLDFEPVPGGLGNYRATIKLEQSGTHVISAHTTEADWLVTKNLTVEKKLTEVVGRPIDLALLTQLARDTRGMTMDLANLSPMLERITERLRHKPQVDIFELWADPKWGGLILFLLALYWTLRKVLGLI